MKNTKDKKEKWPLERVIEVFLLAFGALVLFGSMVISMTAERFAFTADEAKGIVIASALIVEAGIVMNMVRRRKANKDISFQIGACIGVLLMAILQLVL